MKIPFTNVTLQAHNVLSCRGFETVEKVGLSFGPCAQAKLGLVLLFFINAFVRKWIGEEMGVDYSFWGGLGGALGAYLVLITFTGSFLVSLIAGLIGLTAFGFLGGRIFGGGDGGYE